MEPCFLKLPCPYPLSRSSSAKMAYNPLHLSAPNRFNLLHSFFDLLRFVAFALFCCNIFLFVLILLLIDQKIHLSASRIIYSNCCAPFCFVTVLFRFNLLLIQYNNPLFAHWFAMICCIHFLYRFIMLLLYHTAPVCQHFVLIFFILCNKLKLFILQVFSRLFTIFATSRCALDARIIPELLYILIFSVWFSFSPNEIWKKI